MSKALIKPELIRWARLRSALTPDQVAGAGLTAAQVRRWEDGDENPTYIQATKLANTLRVPLGYLYLEEPPELPEPLADLRTLPDAAEEMSPGLRQVINDCKVKQDWYREYLIAEGAEPLDFIGRFSLENSAEEVASDIRSTLDLDSLRGQTRADSWDAYLKLLTDRAEAAGITVIRSGIVGSNTHWKLSVREFRGFAIPDEYAPLVFINSLDWKTSQIFTLIHEVAHIWLAEGGVSNLEPSSLPNRASKQRLEIFCNAVSAEVLVPAEELLPAWVGSKTESLLARLSTRFRVSGIVILLRALDLGLVSEAEFEETRAGLSEKTTTAQSTGGDFYNNFPLRNGRHLSTAMLAAALNGRLLYHEAARMLGVRVPTLFSMAEEYGLR